jgi:DNA-binding MarR family transcriptional regulator
MATTHLPEVQIQTVVHALPEIVRGAHVSPAGLGHRLSVPQVRALIRLAGAQALTMTELARALGISCAAATQLADGLVALGLAERDRPDWDRRVVLVHLTDSARATVQQILAVRTRQVEEVLAALSPAERDAFARGMQILAEVLVRDLDAGDSPERALDSREVRA